MTKGNGGIPTISALEQEAAKISHEIGLIDATIQDVQRQLSAAQRARAEASSRADDINVSKYLAEASRLVDTLEMLTDRKKPLETKAAELYQKVSKAAEERANHELRSAQARSENELRDVGQRLKQARITVGDLSVKYQQLETRLQILRSNDVRPGAPVLDSEAKLARARSYGQVSVKDDRPIIELKSGQSGRFVGRVGFNGDFVIEVESTRERITVPASEVAAEKAAVAV